MLATSRLRWSRPMRLSLKRSVGMAWAGSGGGFRASSTLALRLVEQGFWPEVGDEVEAQRLGIVLLRATWITDGQGDVVDSMLGMELAMLGFSSVCTMVAKRSINCCQLRK